MLPNFPNSRSAFFSRSRLATKLAGLVLVALMGVSLVAQQRASRPEPRVSRGDQDRTRTQRPEAQRPETQRAGAQRPGSVPQPMGAEDCRDASHAADHVGDPLDSGWLHFCNMFPASEATQTAVKSGAWSDPSTWDKGVPISDARVFIPPNMRVTVDQELSVPLFWVRVEGLLRFSPESNTSLVADTLKIESSGRLEIGTAAAPIPAGRTARVVVKARDGKPIDHSWDPLEISRGVIVHGTVEMHGSPKTAFVPVSTMPRPGSLSIVVDRTPSGWLPGDVLVFTATEYDQDETFIVKRVEGTTITLDRPVKNVRTLPSVVDIPGAPKPALHLANFTRNVQITSAAEYAGNPQLQGHVMLMHRGGHQIAWVGFHDLGRTTVRPVTDPTVVAGRREPGTSPEASLPAENVRGRYSLHFHRTGPASEVSRIEGCAIQVRRGAGLKIGLANHSSNVSVRSCVSHNIDGSHYFTEEGDERGEFTGNLAVHSVGSGATHDEQPRDVDLKRVPALQHRRRLDVGHRGTGYWLNGGGVDVVDNVSAGQAHSGFHLWTRPLNFRLTDTYAVKFPVANLRDRGWAGAVDSLQIEDVPIRFTGNTAYVLGRARYGGEGGFLFEYHGISVRSRFRDAPFSQFHDLLSWNAGGLRTQYTGNLHLKNVRIIGDSRRPNDFGARLGTQGGNSDLIENLMVEGFTRGVALPARSVLAGGTFATPIGISIGEDATIDLTGMRFEAAVAPAASTTQSRLRGTGTSSQVQYDLYMQPYIQPMFVNGRDFNPSLAFAARRPGYVRGHPDVPGTVQAYSVEQMPDYVLPDFGIPGLLDGKTTTRDAWEKYRLAPGGAMAPAGTAPLPGVRSNGVFGSPVDPEPSVSPRGAGRVAVDRPARAPGSRDQGTVGRPAPEEVAARREQLRAERAARRPAREANVRPSREETSADREARPRNPVAPRGAQPEAAGDRSAATGPGWQLAPREGGGMILVRTGSLPRLPTVNAGPDQVIAVADPAVLRGAVGAAANARWSRAYGPGPVSFADAGRAQTEARFSAPGLYVLHLTAEESGGARNTATVTIRVTK